MLWTVIYCYRKGGAMKIVIINGSSVPLYQQIKDAVKENIMEGRLKEDQQLPSVRELSKELKVSILTVKKAYDELEEEGFIVIRQGLGSFVASNNEELKKEEKQKDLEANLMEACKLARLLDLSKEDLMELTDFIYEEVKNGE